MEVSYLLRHVMKIGICLIVMRTLSTPFLAVIHGPDGPTPYSQYEHSSIPATVKKLFNLKSNFLTKRDAWAGTFEKYFYIRDTPRDDCPGLHLLLRMFNLITSFFALYFKFDP